jgi:uncharacterized repeat protein (TIGR01451 family)
MTAGVGQLAQKLVLAAGLMLLSGCFGVSQNPSYFPYLLPTGDIIRTHAKPGFGYFSNFDPHAVRLEVRPLDATNPVQTQHVLIATVYDEKNVARRHRRVEWMVEGVGNIVEVDESGFLPGRGYKIDNKYAVSYTDYKEHRITRGNANPNDDFVIRPGQTWCVITSAVEGDTHVTVYAPEIYDWDKSKVFVSKHWVDAEWILPPPATARAGTQQVFVTNIFKHTDHQPLANYRVRYRILDGPPAIFVPSHTQEAVAITDLNGNAAVTIAQTAPQQGINRIGIEIVRPPDPLSPSGSGIIIGRGETAVEWQAPAVGITKTGPATAAVGQDIPYTITVTNTGKIETQAMTVRDAVPDGLQYVRSEPPAMAEGNQLTWTLGALAAGQTHSLQVTFKSSRVGAVTNSANVTTVEGLHADNAATTQITSPQLNVAKTGPTTALVGVPITYQITVGNPGTGPAANVLLSDQFDEGLEHESKANPVELRVGTLGPNETRTIPLTLIPRRLGTLVNRVTATADGNLRAQAQHPVTVQKPQMTIDIKGPSLRFVDKPAVFDIRVTNPGDVALTNVVVRHQLPPELAFESATEGGTSAGGQVVWNLGTLGSKQERTVQVTTRCLRLTPRALNVAVATADGGIEVQAQAPLEIQGVPAVRLQVVDFDNPLEVGARTTYKINVTNQGSLPGSKIEVVAQVPQQMRIITADGPSKPKIVGQRVEFPPADGLASKETWTYSVTVEALQPGDLRFKVELRTSTLQEPLVEEKSTTVFAPGPGPAPPRTTVPPGGTAAPPPGGATAPAAPPGGTTAPPPGGTTGPPPGGATAPPPGGATAPPPRPPAGPLPSGPPSLSAGSAPAPTPQAPPPPTPPVGPPRLLSRPTPDLFFRGHGSRHMMTMVAFMTYPLPGSSSPRLC